MIPYDADFSRYKVVVAPVLYMVKQGMKEAMEVYVKNAGILIITYISGIVNESDNAGSNLQKSRKLCFLFCDKLYR